MSEAYLLQRSSARCVTLGPQRLIGVDDPLEGVGRDLYHSMTSRWWMNEEVVVPKSLDKLGLGITPPSTPMRGSLLGQR